METSEPNVIAAHAAARVLAFGEKANASGAKPRPHEALPKQLYACMQELLACNERYHQLMQHSRLQDEELSAGRAELEQLRSELDSTRRVLRETSEECARHEEVRSTMPPLLAESRRSRHGDAK